MACPWLSWLLCSSAEEMKFFDAKFARLEEFWIEKSFRERVGRPANS
jgi:hypothetical protein